MGPGQKFLTRVRLGQPFMVWVWIWKISPKNVKFFNFFPLGSKKISSGRVRSTRVEGELASYLLRVKSKLGSGQGPSLVKSHHIQQQKHLSFATFLYAIEMIKIYKLFEATPLFESSWRH